MTTDDNRDAIRERGGLAKLLQLLESRNDFVLENSVSALKNCLVNERSMAEFVELKGIAHLIVLLSHENESVVREAVLCLKNVAMLEENSAEIGRLHGLEQLLQVINVSKSDTLRKMAAFLIQTLAKHRTWSLSFVLLAYRATLTLTNIAQIVYQRIIWSSLRHSNSVFQIRDLDFDSCFIGNGNKRISCDLQFSVQAGSSCILQSHVG